MREEWEEHSTEEQLERALKLPTHTQSRQFEQSGIVIILLDVRGSESAALTLTIQRRSHSSPLSALPPLLLQWGGSNNRRSSKLLLCSTERRTHKIYALRFWQMFRLRLHSLLASRAAPLPCGHLCVGGRESGRGTLLLLLPCTRCTCGHYSLFVAQLGSFALLLVTLLVVSASSFPLLLLFSSSSSCACCCCCFCNAFLTLLILVLFCRVVLGVLAKALKLSTPSVCLLLG